MQLNRDTFLPLDSPGVVTTFYAYEGGPARNALLAAMALQLAGEPSQAPVLVIDWDLEAPALHAYLGQDAGEAAGAPGLVEYFGALREALRQARCEGQQRPRNLHANAQDNDGGALAEAIADAALDAVDWRDYVERADGRRPLYLMRAGRFDDSYAERAGRFDPAALFDACPALFRRFAARMARHFSHVLVASRAGRSSSVSTCTTLVPDRIVGLFTPAPGSLDGLEGVVNRAVEYRCTHEDEQRPLLVYPVACAADGARSDPGGRWRRGDGSQDGAGYQPRLEALLRGAYGMGRVRLDSWFDEVQLPLCDSVALADTGSNARLERRALARPAACLLSWFTHGFFPWQSLAEVRLRREIARVRAAGGVDIAAAAGAAPLAAHLARLGELCQDEGRLGEAEELLSESLALRSAALGEDHAESRAGLRALAALHVAAGRLQEARRDYELLAQACARSEGAGHPDTLAARSRQAWVLGRLGEGERALALHETVVASCERDWGEAHPSTLDSLEDLALTLTGQREFDRARVLYERVLDGRRRLQGPEHGDTLRCGQYLAGLLGELGELGNARRLQEAVLRAREKHDGLEALPTVQARAALAGILAAQGDLAAVQRIQEDRTEDGVLHGAGALGAATPAAESLQRQLTRLQELMGRSPREARSLADRLCPFVLPLSVAHPLRRRATDLIKQVYRQDGDLDALLAFFQDEVSSLEGALFERAQG